MPRLNGSYNPRMQNESSDRAPLTIRQQISAIEAYLRNTPLSFPNSVACLDMGLLFKSLLTQAEHLSIMQPLTVSALGYVHALCGVIDTNGPNSVRETYRDKALSTLLELHQLVELHQIN